MISYEDLCQALDRFNRRRNNEAEMDALNADPQAMGQGGSATAVDLLEGTDDAISLTDEASEILPDDVAAYDSELAPLEGDPTQIADAPPIALEADGASDVLDVPDEEDRPQ